MKTPAVVKQPGDRVGPNDIGPEDVVREECEAFIVDTKVYWRNQGAWHGEVVACSNGTFWLGEENVIIDWEKFHVTLVSRAIGAKPTPPKEKPEWATEPVYAEKLRSIAAGESLAGIDDYLFNEMAKRREDWPEIAKAMLAELEDGS